ncbi:hypothetical protein [Aquimarina rubra]|uniref:DUF4221 domain-containing protein n=1 Tax=Aquimarina rubra TaxID=1920033 RepID=A0ABW5LKH5_9FLAO
MPSFIVLGKKNNSDAFQFDYNEQSQSGTLINLTEQDQIPENYNFIRFTEDIVSFYLLSDIWIKNMNTNTVNKVESYFESTNGELAYLTTNSEDRIFTVYLKSSQSNDLYVRSRNISNSSIDDTLLGQANNVSNILYFQNHLIVSYNYFDGQERKYYVTVLNTTTNAIIKTIEFTEDIRYVTTSYSGDLVLGYSPDRLLFDIKSYRLNTMELINEYSPNTFFFGVIEGQYNQGIIYYQSPFAQPSPISYLPATYNLDNNIANNINILPALDNYAQKDEILRVSHINNIFDYERNTLIVSTTITYEDFTNKVGVFLFDLNGNLLNNVVIDEDFIPNYVFLR